MSLIEKMIVREETVALMNKLMGRKPDLEGRVVFDDVGKSKRFYGDVKAATKTGLKTEE